MAASVLLVLLMFGVGSVMAFALGGATPVALVVGATLVVMAWHGLRRIDPTDQPCRPLTGHFIGRVLQDTRQRAAVKRGR
jgi:hypothetical protein